MTSNALKLVEDQDSSQEEPRKFGSFGRWRPKEWTPVYEQIVALSCLNWSNTAIASHFSFTPQHVSNVLSTPEAKISRRRILDRLQEMNDLNTENKLRALADRAMQNVTKVLTDDALLENSPFAVFDRSMAILKSTNVVKDPEKKPTSSMPGQTNIGKAVFIGSEFAEALSLGLQKAEEAKLLHGDIEIGNVNSNQR